MIDNIDGLSDEYINGYRKALIDVNDDIKENRKINCNYDLSSMLLLIEQKCRVGNKGGDIMSKNNERKFRVVDKGSEWTVYYQIGFECTLDYIKDDLNANVTESFDGSVDELNKLLCVGDLSGTWFIRFEEVFDDSETEYTIDELEEGVEYYMANEPTATTYMIDGEALMSNYNKSRYKESTMSYNVIKLAKFTKVPEIIHYTFDEAKADCIENGTEYVSRWDGEETNITMSPRDGGFILEWSDKDYLLGLIFTSSRTWVKKSDLYR